MRERMQKMPEMKKQENSIQMHFKMVEQVNNIISKKDLVELGELEQQIVTSYDQNRSTSTSKMKL